jgi:hypothetical protein
MLKKFAILSAATVALVAATPAQAIVSGSGYSLGAIKHSHAVLSAMEPSAIDRDAARRLIPDRRLEPAAPAGGRSRALPFELAGTPPRPE